MKKRQIKGLGLLSLDIQSAQEIMTQELGGAGHCEIKVAASTPEIMEQAVVKEAVSAP